MAAKAKSTTGAAAKPKGAGKPVKAKGAGQAAKAKGAGKPVKAAAPPKPTTKDVKRAVKTNAARGADPAVTAGKPASDVIEHSSSIPAARAKNAMAGPLKAGGAPRRGVVRSRAHLAAPQPSPIAAKPSRGKKG